MKPVVKAFLELDPREVLYGARTAANRLGHVTNPNEHIDYVDFTSLYPFVNAHFHYPLGHPKIIRKDFGDVENLNWYMQKRTLHVNYFPLCFL